MPTPDRAKHDVLMETPLPNQVHRGKVRDTFRVNDELLLMVATDRISAFDIVLPNGIPNKGLVLNRISAFWFEKTGHIVPNHFVALADAPDVPIHLDVNNLLGSLPLKVAQQAMVVRQAERIDIECIVRGYITGSAWGEYRRQGTVSGKAMPAGLLEGQEFPNPLFTPTTKAEEGHDQNMSDQEVLDMVGVDLAGQLELASKNVYSFAREYAARCGIILADTKMEFGLLDGRLILIDELLTPDSSRFWDMSGYAPGASQPNYDKQFVRDWLLDQGWNQEPPAPALPEDIVAKTSDRYLDAYWRLTGQQLI
jgi:phosphoribosylaminoimidazole-succinocarboxamide synthase